MLNGKELKTCPHSAVSFHFLIHLRPLWQSRAIVQASSYKATIQLRLGNSARLSDYFSAFRTMAALCLLVARTCSLHSQPNPTAAPGPSANVVRAAITM